jgi:Domain of unknown function (DUF4347)/FG-GAP-like repeat
VLNHLLTDPDSRSNTTPFQTLVVFDERVSNIEILSAALLPGSIGFTISSTDDGLGTISHLLATTGAKYLAIVAHGEPGVVHLGKNSLDISQLQTQSHLLSEWGMKEIALYSCEVAQGDIGKDLIYSLSELTGATVAGAATKIGSAALGGSWDLAITTGELTAPSLFTAEVIQTYSVILGLSFLPASIYNVSGTLVPIAGDLNGDGKIDLVAAGSTTNLSVLLGNGAGSFNITSVPTGFTYSEGTILADLNSDGKLDLVAKDGGGRMSVLLGNGTSGFGAPTSINPGFGSPPGSSISASRFKLGDINGDGKLDLVVSGYYSYPSINQTSVLLGNGAGGFGTPITFNTTYFPTSMVLGDFNGDGKLDLVQTASGGAGSQGSTNISVLLGNGQGNFGAPTLIDVGSNVNNVVTGDFNIDGKLDLAVRTQENVSVLLGNGQGSFGVPTDVATFDSRYFEQQVADINSDGKPDIVVYNLSGGNNISVLLGDGQGGFVANSFASGISYTDEVAVADFNSDGKVDLAIGGGSQLIVRLNNSTPNSNAAIRNDFNGDTKTDIVWRNDNGAIALWQMNGSAVTSNQLVASLTSDWKTAGTGDFNGDTKTDIVWRNDNGAIALWQMNGSTVTSNNIVASLSSDWKASGTGDFGGDGKSDLLWRNDNGAVAMWQMNGSTVTSNKIVASLSSDWKPAGTGDFNGDGKSDMLWRNDNGAIALWQMNGSTVTSSTIVASLSSDWKAAGVGDFNGDGKSDMLWRNDNGAVAMWQMNGSTVTANNIVASLPSDWKSAGIGDFNGDGKSDISWRNDNGANSLWQMNGSTVTNNSLISSLDSSWKIATPII